MSKNVCLLVLLLALVGCGSDIHDNYPTGYVDKGLYNWAVLVNEQRLAGEDKRVIPIYESPWAAIGIGFDALIGRPIGRMSDYFSHDNAAAAARQIFDQSSPDNRRRGVLRLVDYDFARKGASLKVYAHVARDEDYTVRAAAIRALNRSRAQGYTSLFVTNLDDSEPLVRMQAADALGNIPDPSTVDDLIDHMRNDISPEVKIACADALRNFKQGEVISALVEVLDDRNFAVAWQARQSLALISGQDYRYDKQAWLGYFARAGMPE
ncbi:MAG: HEAT repeat domain-containing protein [Tepidisphaeraceae bacterium]|jgi:hypothetical protein